MLFRRTLRSIAYHRVEEHSINMYDKHSSILRIETTINTLRRYKVYRTAFRQGRQVKAWIPMRKGIVDLPRLVQVSRAANERYLEALAVVGETTPSHRLLDPVSTPVQKHNRRYRPLRPISLQESQMFRLLLQPASLLQGVRNVDIQRHLLSDPEDRDKQKHLSARITRQLNLYRAHGLIYKVAHTHTAIALPRSAN